MVHQELKHQGFYAGGQLPPNGPAASNGTSLGLHFLDCNVSKFNIKQAPASGNGASAHGW